MVTWYIVLNDFYMLVKMVNYDIVIVNWEWQKNFKNLELYLKYV